MTRDAETVALLERAKMILSVEAQVLLVKARMTQDAETQAEQIFLVGFSSFC